jgi:hypothetical protein
VYDPGFSRAAGDETIRVCLGSFLYFVESSVSRSMIVTAAHRMNTLKMPLQIAMRSPMNLYGAGAGLDACRAANFALRDDNFSAIRSVEK